MRGASHLIFPATVILLGSSLLLSSSPTQAQGMGTGDGAAVEQETRKTPAMRERVYTRLSEAQACSEMDDIVCAQEKLAEVKEMTDLNSYEIAQMWNFYAFIYFGQDNYREAINAYEMVLQQADLPLGMETTTKFTLTQLYFQEERYQDSLDMLDAWFLVAQNPGPEPYILRAQVHYQLEDYLQGIPAVLEGIEVAKAQEKTLQENWYRLLNVFYYELEDYPNVISVLRTIIDTWPKREYFVQLSAMYGQEGNEIAQLGLYELAHDVGWLQRSNEYVQMAQLLLGQDIPVKAAQIMETGLNDGTIDANENNWRVLAQAWQLAQEDEKALPALARAAGLTENGELDLRLAQSHQNLANWQECIDSARDGLRKGDLRREDQGNMILGACLFELGEYSSARTAFETAEEDTRSRAAAQSWIQYVNSEQDRDEQLRVALDR
jgi:tetratricopeptide (TPR) repeat protein